MSNSLWIPPSYAPDPAKTREVAIPLPERPQDKKRVATKWRYGKGHPWIPGAVINVPKDFDIHETLIRIEGAEMTLVASARLYLTGMIERRTGTFVYQDGDHMQSNMLVEEWTLDDEEKAGGYAERWRRFMEREP